MTNPASLRKIRVMVVDDSMVARSLIIKGLSAHLQAGVGTGRRF